MHEENRVRGIVRDLGGRYAIAGFQLSAEGTAGLHLPGNIELSLEYVPATGKLFAYTRIAPVPSQEKERLALLEVAMKMNCLESESGGTTLALDAVRDVLIAQITLATQDLSLERLDQALHHMLAQRERIVQELARPPRIEPPAGSSAFRGSFTRRALQRRA